MAEANQLLRAARQATASPRSPGFALSRSELAELISAAVYRHTGRVVTLDGHYVAKLERGVIRWPGEEYRRAFREVLGAATDSELGFRRPRCAADATPPLLPPRSRPGNETERERLAWILAGRCRVDQAVVTYLREVQAAQRRLEDMIGSSRTLPIVLAEIELVEQLTRQACGGVRAALVAVAAEYHLFAGQMSDYNGDQRAALYHDDRALGAAQEVDDPNVAAAVFGFKAHLAWGVRDAAGTVALAEAGQRDVPRLSARVEGFGAQMQARGHALRREGVLAQRLLDKTEQFTGQAHEHPQNEPWWAYPQTPDRALFQRGVAYLELGKYREARNLFEQARAALPTFYRRDHGRWAASLAVACAHDGDVAGAVTAGWQAVGIVLDTGSVYTIADLHCMRQVLHRQQADRAILDEFDEALREIVGPTRR
jgi:tetratricopeptide (TPR) repeat protein